MITDPVFFAVAVPAVLLSGLSKGGLGGGIGVIGVLSLAMVTSPAQAAAVMLPILCLMDPMGVWAYRKSWDRESAIILSAGALIGIALGGLTFRFLDERMIRLFVGTISVSFTLNYMLQGTERGLARRLQSRTAGMILGGVSGLTSFLIHAGLPTTAMFLLPKRMDRRAYVGTIAVTFFIMNYAKLVPYAWLGLLSTENLSTSLVLVPFAPIGMWFGVRLNRRFSNLWFYRVSYAALFCMGLKLISTASRHRSPDAAVSCLCRPPPP